MAKLECRVVSTVYETQFMSSMHRQILPRLVERNVMWWSTGESNRSQRAPNRVRSRSMEDVFPARYPTPGMMEERRSLHLLSAAISHVLWVAVGAITATTCCHAGTASHKQNKQHCRNCFHVISCFSNWRYGA